MGSKLQWLKFKIRKTVEIKKHLHQGKQQGARQSYSQHQGKPPDAIVTSGSDQITTAESEWSNEELMDLIEAAPCYDQIIHSIQEMMPHGLGS